jgi:hypothetical protein
VIPVDEQRAVGAEADGVGMVATDGEDDVGLGLGDGDLETVVEDDAGGHHDIGVRAPVPAVKAGGRIRGPAYLRRAVDYDRFIGTVSERAHAPAEAIGEDEFHDTAAQLPGEYRVLLRRR